MDFSTRKNFNFFSSNFRSPRKLKICPEKPNQKGGKSKADSKKTEKSE